MGVGEGQEQKQQESADVQRAQRRATSTPGVERWIEKAVKTKCNASAQPDKCLYGEHLSHSPFSTKPLMSPEVL
jgi:hypothetical protein